MVDPRVTIVRMHHRVSEPSFRETVASLAGQRVSRVLYHGLAIEGIPEWDFGEWHNPVMGVSLSLEDGTPYSAVWGHSFGMFCLEMAREPMDRFLAGPEWEVTTNPRWASLIRHPITNAGIVWKFVDHANRTAPVPVAVHLRFPNGEAWIVAALPHRESSPATFSLAADEVIVVFTPALARALELPEPS
jgi:hypothetical protein